MIKILLSDLKIISEQKPAGYYEDVLARGRIETAEIVVLDNADYIELKIKYAPQSIPRKEWPTWAKALAMIAKPEDKGIGDVVARTIGAENSEAFKKWYKSTTGKDCGCTGRQNSWNIKYPLNSKAI